MKTFALDVDGVLLNVVPGAIDYVEKKYGVVITEADFTDWDWDYALSLPEGVTPEFWQHVWIRSARPYPGAVDFVNKLKDEFKVIAVSTRPKHWKGIGDIAYQAAQRDFSQIPFDEVYLVERHSQKAELLGDAEYFVEDNPKIAAQCGHGTMAEVFLMTRPWNRQCSTVTGAWTRVYNYQDILNRI